MAEKVWIPAFTGMTEKDVGRITTSFPIPAHAGVYGRKSLDPRLRGDDGKGRGTYHYVIPVSRRRESMAEKAWIPAFAGMTARAPG